MKVTEAPSMSDMDIEKGWNVITGQANYTDGTAKGLVTLITATGNEKMANVVVMTNTDKYQEEILAFVNSLEINEPATEKNNTSNANNNTDQNSIAGIWGQYQNESNTAGYDYREYYFNADGTYQFLEKNISYLYHNDIIYVYEKGTYKLNGNKLSISPQSGSVESWSKAGSDKPGKLLKTEKRPLESVTYNIDFHYFSGNNETNLILQHNKQTLRDGAWSTNNSFKNSWLYKRPFTPNKSAIELPAGTKISLNKSSGSSLTQNNTTTVVHDNSPPAGKIWEAQTLEKFGSSGNSTYSGGVRKYQYKFNANGSYQFVYCTASGLANNPVQLLQYETGTYTVNGNQLTITPLKGANDEWSVGKINNGMSAEHIRKVLKTRLTKLKSSARKLERITYPFTIEYWQGNEANALCLKHTQNTIREGSPGQNDQRCFFETTSAKAENFNGLFK